jgi:hypothetical protein
MENSLKYNWKEFFKICDDSKTRLGGQDFVQQAAEKRSSLKKHSTIISLME